MSMLQVEVVSTLQGEAVSIVQIKGPATCGTFYGSPDGKFFERRQIKDIAWEGAGVYPHMMINPSGQTSIVHFPVSILDIRQKWPPVPRLSCHSISLKYTSRYKFRLGPFAQPF